MRKQFGTVAVVGLLVVVSGCGGTGHSGSPVCEGCDGGENNRHGEEPTDSQRPGGNTNVSFGGSQDIGYFRRLLADGVVPTRGDIDSAGFFAEYHTPLPDPTCGERVCLQGMLGVMGNLLNGENCTLLQVGLNSTIVLDPEDRPDLNLAVVVDVSGSMGHESKIGFVRAGLRTLINSLHDTDKITLISYATQTETLFELNSLRNHRNELSRLIDRLEAEGGTNLHDGLEAGYRALARNYESDRQNRVILLSDGQPTAGITDTPSILSMSSAHNSDGLGLTTVGLGTSFNVELMRGLAEQADGNFYFLESAEAVAEVFEEELAYFTLPIAFDIKLEVSAGPHYRFGNAYGSNLFASHEQGGSLNLPSAFLAHRKSHDQGGRRGGGSALLLEWMPTTTAPTHTSSAVVANINLEFREPGTNATVTDSMDVTFQGNPNQTPTAGTFDNAIVTKSFVMLNALVGIQMALDAFHGGATAEALGLLLRLAAAMEDYNDGANLGESDDDIARDIDLVRQLIGVMESNGAVNESPDIPEDPWPAD